MTCNVRTNSINHLRNLGFIDNNMFVINAMFFNENNKLTDVARNKYNVKGPGRLFNTVTLPNDRVKAVMNESLFDELQKNHNAFGKTPEDAPFQLSKDSTTTSRASARTIGIVKDFLKRIGVDIKTLESIVVNGVKQDANGAAIIAQKLIQVVEGMEDVALPEEAMHFAVEIIQQTSPTLFNKLLKEINSYKMYSKVVADYSTSPFYQTADGKPDILKLKKEAIAKVLTEKIIKKSESKLEKPENLARVQTWWDEMVNFFKGLFSSSGFDKAAMMVLTGQFNGTPEEFRNQDTFLQMQDMPIQQRVVASLKAVSSRMTKAVGKDGKYTIDGREIRFRVSDDSKTWYDNRFRDKALVKSEYANAVDSLKMEKGTDGHADIENMLKLHLLDAEGRFIKEKKDRPSDESYVSKLNPYDRTMYTLLKKNMEERLASFPDGTVFLVETMVYDPSRDMAGTIDFIAVEPTGKMHLLDWKFTDVKLEKTQDVPWYKVGAWKVQMKGYKRILQSAYNIKFDGSEQTRMIPIRAIYTEGNKAANIKPSLVDLEVGDINLRKENRAYLLPVGLEEERTGNKRIDNILEQLNNVYDILSSRKATPSAKRDKAEQLNSLYNAMRQLKVRQNITPLINQAGILNKEISKILKEYEENWQGKPLDNHTRAERNDFSSKIMSYENTLKVYSTLYKNLKNVFGLDPTEEEKKILDELRKVSDDANDLENDLETLRNDFAENIVAKSENVLDFLKPEKIIRGFSRWFGTTSTLQLKSIELLYKMANRAFSMASMDTVEQGNELKSIKTDYDRWAKSKGLNNKNYFDILKKKGSNELIDEYDSEFYKKLRSEIQDKNKSWVRDNIDVEEYRKFLKQYKEEEYLRIERKTRWGNDEDINREISYEKSTADQLYNIDTADSAGWLLYDLAKKFPKKDWQTKEWKTLNTPENAPAKKFYDYIRKRNEYFYNIGYIHAKEQRVFLPYVRKSLMEKIVMGGQLTLGEGLLRSITVSEGDVGWGDINPITKEPTYNIPKYFIRDTGEETSDDLFKNMTLINEIAIRYEYLSEVEDQINLIVRTEANKEAIATSYFGKTKYKEDGDIATTADNSENTQLLRDMVQAIVYGHKFVDSQNFDQLLGGMGKLGEKLNKKLGIKLLPENFSGSQISLNKSIAWVNNTFQLTRLGLNPLSALSNLLGGSFQSFINAGTYFTKAEFMKNEFLIHGRMNGVDAKKYLAALEYFVPLTENYNLKLARELSLSKLSQEGVQDFLMSLMRKSDQFVQTVNFFSYLDNTVVVNGRLLNAREYLRTTEKYSDVFKLSGELRKKREVEFEEDVKKLIDENGIMKVAKLEGNSLVIPGINKKSDDVILLRRKVQGITKAALGNLSEDDMRLINMNIYGKSFMIFKNWIPRLVDVRFGNLKYNAASEAYEWGRTRMLFRVLQQDLKGSAKSLISAMAGNNDQWVEQMRALYEAKKADYERDTGKTLRMTEAEFIELTNKNIRNQMVDFLFYLGLTFFIVALKAIPPEDEDKATQNKYKYLLRAMDKIRDEIAYFYNPTSLINLTKSGLFPSIQLIENFVKLFSNFTDEMYAIGVGDEKLEEKTKVIKYALKGFPITAQFDAIFLLFFPDIAKDLGMRAQTEAKPFGR